MKRKSPRRKAQLWEAHTRALLARHFAGLSLTELVTTARRYPLTLRVDLQRIFDELTSETGEVLGVHIRHAFQTTTLSTLLALSHRAEAPTIGPMQFDEIDVGEAAPMRCVRTALWLSKHGDARCVLLISPSMRHSQTDGVHVEIAVAAGEAGKRVADGLWQIFERRLASGRSYAGKVLSLEADSHYQGLVGAVRVHRLRPVAREELILPEATVTLLERNVIRFAAQRPSLAKAGLSQKKGVLFYGPPGTGKTHTLHFLAGRLRDHTTLLITAEQVVFLDDYFRLARYLQPALVVLEDVDLIARQRNQLRSGCEESLLNKLLNEMDGLREDAAITFILTTNAPEQLELALAGRPGRIDQAIEFPLPDEESRRKLARLYACDVPVSEELVVAIAQRTERASASFIKELMRRARQFSLERSNPEEQLTLPDVEAALHEMVAAGGTLNRRLLGFASA